MAHKTIALPAELRELLCACVQQTRFELARIINPSDLKTDALDHSATVALFTVGGNATDYPNMFTIDAIGTSILHVHTGIHYVLIMDGTYVCTLIYLWYACLNYDSNVVDI